MTGNVKKNLYARPLAGIAGASAASANASASTVTTGTFSFSSRASTVECVGWGVVVVDVEAAIACTAN
jgi:hypothetical protein